MILVTTNHPFEGQGRHITDLPLSVSRWSNCFPSEELYHVINTSDLASFAADHQRSPAACLRLLRRHLVGDSAPR
jgi:hypothetical protein